MRSSIRRIGPAGLGSPTYRLSLPAAGPARLAGRTAVRSGGAVSELVDEGAQPFDQADAAGVVACHGADGEGAHPGVRQGAQPVAHV